MSTRRLGEADRRFFALLADVVFGNPFAEEPEGLRALVPDAPAPRGRHRHDHYVPFVVPALAARLSQLDAERRCHLSDFPADEARLLEYGVLYDCYSRHATDMDDLIERQVQAGEEPVEAPFAVRVLEELEGRGVARPAALRYLALFYQLRRGFYFIEQSLVGQSPSMRALRRALWDSAFTRDVRVYERHLWDRMEDFSTLVLGETGTGKGAAAAAIGRSGYIPFEPRRARFARSFVATFNAINLSQFSESLIESELFGHRRGAFTGAVDDHRGVLERCTAHGTLFLDEIGEVSVPVQIKLLQVLQERTFRPVGSPEERRFEGRVVAATNRSLDRLRQDGAFRDDFYYRLCSDVVIVPTLRERIEQDPAELRRLVRLLIGRIVGEPAPDLAGLVLDALGRDLPKDYAWPGNVRELEQATRRVLLTGRYTGDTRPRDSDAEQVLVEGVQAGTLEVRELLARYCGMLHERLGTYEAVARRTGLDRRTAKRHADSRAEFGDG